MEYRLISEFFEADHDRLDELYKNYQVSAQTDFSKAKEYFAAFKLDLQRHIAWEEELLFPLFESRTGMLFGGPTAIMREEHRQIAEHLEAVYAKLEKGDPNTYLEESRLLGVLSIHNQKEEDVLYPSIDKLALDADKAVIFRTVQSSSEVTPASL